MDVANVIQSLVSSGFRDLAGSQASARIPISQSLLNGMVADALRGVTTTRIRRVDVRPRAGDRFDVTVETSWPLFPRVSAVVVVERQPRFPEDPILVLRWSLPGALGGVVSRAIRASSQLAPGVRIDGDRLVIDLEAAGRRFELAIAMLPFVRALEVHTVEGAVVIDGELAVPNAA
jgi:hypothetical protein